MAMFSATDKAGTTFSSWWMKRSPRRCAAAGLSMLTALPSMLIDAVSGATITSRAYVKSLQAILDAVVDS